MKLKVTLVRSLAGRPEAQRKIIEALGLGKVGSSAVHDDTPAIQGMVRKCAHLVAVENIAE